MGFTGRYLSEMAIRPVMISGALGDDAKHYQVRAVQSAIKELKP